MNINEEEAKINVKVDSSQPISVNVEDRHKIDVVVGDAAKMDCQKAINYIKVGTDEIKEAVESGISEFNENASDKTTVFNTNATNKTNSFNDNASEKTTAFNDNATEKTGDFNTNATNKTKDFNDNYTAKKALIDAEVQTAQGAAQTATTKAGEASSSASLAKQWAIGDPTEPTGNSAKYWANQASSELSTLTSRVSTIEGKIPSSASASNQLADKSYVNTADNGLQSQIDAIVASSDVFDIVGTYAELQAYDISTVPVNDIIKVLVDSTHENAATYYRCVETGGVKSWSYIGTEGAYYTKAQSDARFATAAQGALADTAVQPSDLATVATTGDYDDLIDKPTIPTVNNATLTITQGGVSKGTFTANASSDVTIALDAGGGGGAVWGSITGTLSNQTDLNNALGEKLTFIVGSLPEATEDDVDKVIYQVNEANEVHPYKGFETEYTEEEWAEAILEESEPTVGGMDFDLVVFKELYQMEYGEKEDSWWEEAFDVFPVFTLTREEVGGSYYAHIYWYAYSDINPLSDTINNAFTFYDEDWEEEIPIEDIESASWEVYYYPGSTYTEYSWSPLKTTNAVARWGNIQGSISSQTDLNTALSGKADTDLSNLSSTGQKVIDGQWVHSELIIEDNVTAGNTNVTYSLSSYLPNDAYNYEVLFTGYAITTTTSGTSAELTLFTDIITSGVSVCFTYTRTSSRMEASGSVILPIGQAREIIRGGDSSRTGTRYLIAKGYRRIGTNS